MEDGKNFRLYETKAGLQKKMHDLQESMDAINYKIYTYDQKCEPIMNELIASWKENKK